MRRKNPDNVKLRDTEHPTVLGYELHRDTLTPIRPTFQGAKNPAIGIGARVAYSDINLRFFRMGMVAGVGPSGGGADCTVKWDAQHDFDSITVGEWSPNLVVVKG